MATMLALIIFTIAGLISYFNGLSINDLARRTYGMVLIGFVVIRLLFIDVWNMELFGRVLTFLTIGVLLMCTAFVTKKKMNTLLLKKFIFILLVLAPVSVFALISSELTTDDIFQAFRFYKNVTPSITVPTVVEIPINKDSFSIPTFAVYNLDTKEFEPYLFSVNNPETKVYLQTGGEVDIPSSINDGDYLTYFEFPIEGDVVNNSTLNFNFEKSITASSLNFTLDSNVALPKTISISAKVAGKDYVVLAPVKLISGNIVFPKTTASRWQITFSYIQPLRISEIKFNDLSTDTATRGLRFLAQPNQSYQVYFDADRYLRSFKKEAGDLFSSKGVVHLTMLTSVTNAKYKPVDSDLDSVSDFSDNCIGLANSDQKDSDSNGKGDACEDYDRDGIVNKKDNCRDVPNVAQTDTDADGMGDVCDSLDNRVTERMPWLPWAGIGIALVVVLGLFIVVFKHKKDI
jgi:hypothetical protein